MVLRQDVSRGRLAVYLLAGAMKIYYFTKKYGSALAISTIDRSEERVYSYS